MKSKAFQFKLFFSLTVMHIEITLHEKSTDTLFLKSLKIVSEIIIKIS